MAFCFSQPKANFRHSKFETCQPCFSSGLPKNFYRKGIMKVSARAMELGLTWWHLSTVAFSLAYLQVLWYHKGKCLVLFFLSSKLGRLFGQIQKNPHKRLSLCQNMLQRFFSLTWRSFFQFPPWIFPDRHQHIPCSRFYLMLLHRLLQHPCLFCGAYTLHLLIGTQHVSL